MLRLWLNRLHCAQPITGFKSSFELLKSLSCLWLTWPSSSSQTPHSWSGHHLMLALPHDTKLLHHDGQYRLNLCIDVVHWMSKHVTTSWFQTFNTELRMWPSTSASRIISSTSSSVSFSWKFRSITQIQVNSTSFAMLLLRLTMVCKCLDMQSLITLSQVLWLYHTCKVLLPLPFTIPIPAQSVPIVTNALKQCHFLSKPKNYQKLKTYQKNKKSKTFKMF